jgi:hypothetical protein
VAQLHDLGTGLLGIMFDQQGKHRRAVRRIDASERLVHNFLPETLRAPWSM